ncbi:MAG TPA: chemotaxis-specific protein-glutamate methyltransferase CheB [Myxococcales bacterium]
MIPAAPIRVLLVDDSLFVRKAFARVLADEEGIEVVGEAGDGEEALARCQALKPNVVLLDLGMPVLDGLSCLKRLRRELPGVAVVVVSAAAQRGAQLGLEALEAGAFDLIDKASVPLMQVHELGTQLASRIRAAAVRRHASGLPMLLPSRSYPAPEVVVMAASTGGPLALLALLARLPASFPAPVALVQHIADGFVEALASRLGQVCPLKVLSPATRQELVPGCVYLPHGGRDFALTRRAPGSPLVLQPRLPRPGSPHVPSADTLFETAAASAGARAWGVLLTGMGADGARGLLAIARRGGLTVAQDESTSAVWGMPRAAVELGAARAVLPLHEIPAFLTQSIAVGGAACTPGAPAQPEEA